MAPLGSLLSLAGLTGTCDHCNFRDGTGHMNIRTSHLGSKAQYKKGCLESWFVESSCVCGLFGALLTEATHRNLRMLTGCNHWRNFHGNLWRGNTPGTDRVGIYLPGSWYSYSLFPLYSWGSLFGVPSSLPSTTQSLNSNPRGPHLQP